MLFSRSRLVSALVAVLVAGAVLVGVPAPAGAANPPENNCQNYACPDPTGWASARWYPHSDYPSFGGAVNGANCTNYVAWRLMRTVGMPEALLGGLGNANTWDTRAAAKGYIVDRKPTVGSVAQWDWNHVAYVEKVYGDGTILVSESNIWLGTPSNRYWLRYKVVTASTVDHFIHFRPPGVPKTVLAPGDFNRDGKPDVIAQLASGELRLYRGNGSGGFIVPGGSRIGTGWAGRVVAPGDFNGDKKPDLIGIASNGAMYLYRGNGTGGLLSGKTKIGSGWGGMRIVFSSGDFSGDGRADLLAVRADGTLWLYAGTGRGKFTGKPFAIGSGFATATQVSSPGDFDGDGKADVVAIWPDGSATVYRGAGIQPLPETGVSIASGWTDVTTFAGRGDVTGDGLTDVFAVRGGSSLYLYSGDGTTLGTTAAQPDIVW